MSQPYDTVVYQLKDRATIVYIGTTNDPDEREATHERAGKKFTGMLTSRRMTRDGARNLEKEMLADYRKSHGDKNPKYNRDLDG